MRMLQSSDFREERFGLGSSSVRVGVAEMAGADRCAKQLEITVTGPLVLGKRLLSNSGGRASRRHDFALGETQLQPNVGQAFLKEVAEKLGGLVRARDNAIIEVEGGEIKLTR